MSAVIKLGGSLAADPRRLRGLLAAIADGAHGPCVIVPGGGPYADAVRVAQARDGFDDAEAHRRALGAMGRMARAFRDLEPRLAPTRAPRAPSPVERTGCAAQVWDPARLRAGHPDIPESWDVTSDSLALWLATRLAVALCALVKSADAPRGLDPAGLARAGLVDPAFPTFAARFPGAIEVWGPAGAVPVARWAAA